MQVKLFNLSTFAVTLCLVFASRGVLAADAFEIKRGFLTGNEYRALAYSEKRGYAMGFLDGVFISPLYGASKQRLRTVEQCTVGMTNDQMVAILDKWLADNPGRWHESMISLAFGALRDSCKR